MVNVKTKKNIKFQSETIPKKNIQQAKFWVECVFVYIFILM